MFNVKEIDYGNRKEYVLYRKPILEKQDMLKRVKKNKSNNVINDLIKNNKTINIDINKPISIDIMYSGLVSVLTDEKNKSIKNSINRSRKQIYNYSQSNNWDWFITLTFSPEKVNSRYDYIELSDKVKNWLNNIKKRYSKDMKYILVPDLHDDKAIHFHGMLANVDEKALQIKKAFKVDKQGNYMLNQKKEKIPLYDKSKRRKYNIGRYNYGYNDLVKVSNTNKLAIYITKYITKNIISIVPSNKSRYLVSNNCNLPIESNLMLSKNQLKELKSIINYNMTIDKDSFKKTIEVKDYDYSNTIDKYIYTKNDDVLKVCDNMVLDKV